jgi:hypothetical protein
MSQGDRQPRDEGVSSDDALRNGIILVDRYLVRGPRRIAVNFAELPALPRKQQRGVSGQREQIAPLATRRRSRTKPDPRHHRPAAVAEGRTSGP